MGIGKLERRTELTEREEIVEYDVLQEVEAERRRQDRKFGVNWELSADRFQAIKTEEDLEVVRALNDHETSDQVIKELTQVAAVCVRWITAIKMGGAQ